MNSRSLVILLSLGATVAHARLGETREQSEARYGLPKAERPLKGLTPLLPEARELTFHYAGFRIRCAFLPASDGVEYVFREEYVKLTPAKLNQQEVEAILEGERNELAWAPLVQDPRQKGPSLFIGYVGGSVLKRTDGAMAAFGSSQYQVCLELPQATKWEEQLKLAKEEKTRAVVPKF